MTAMLGCASAGSIDATDAAEHGNGDTAAFVLQMRGVAYDYDPAPDPAALAARADLVVRGTIVGVEPGRSSAPAEGLPPDTVTSVLQIRVAEVLAGDAGLVADGSIYLEIDHPAEHGTGTPVNEEGGGEWVPFDLEAFAKTVPVGAEGVFFVADVTDSQMSGVVLDRAAGRPQGAPLVATYVQGFLIEDADGSLVSVKEPFSAMPDGWHDLETLSAVVRAISEAPLD
jgi:hypothetical protein